MTLALDRTVQELGDGGVVSLESGEKAFKLDSFAGNPIVKPQDLGLTWHENGDLKIGAVFNGGAEVFEDRVILMPRCHRGYQRGTFFDERLGRERICLENYVSEVWPLVSEDGIHFTRFEKMVIRGDGTDHLDFCYGIEDIRIVRSGRRYLLVGCGKVEPAFKGKNADRVVIYSTEDFLSIRYHGMIASFDSRNAVPFPEPVKGIHYMLFRFHPNIHLEFLEGGMDQLLNPSAYGEEWKKIYERRDQNLLLQIGRYQHEEEKIGPGSQAIRTDKGWLIIYHAVGEIPETICRAFDVSVKIERGYSVCACLLDLDEPRKVLCRTRYPIYIPSAPYELHGNNQYRVDVPAVVFPVGAVVHGDKLMLYAGAGDKYIILLSCSLDNLVRHLWEYCRDVS
jgi:predicted GH43/DUF377 family glycosyl hydrolase